MFFTHQTFQTWAVPVLHEAKCTGKKTWIVCLWVVVGLGDRGCWRICSGDGSQLLTMHSAVISLGLGPLWKGPLSSQGLSFNERYLEDRRCYRFLSLLPRSWIKCSSTCAPVRICEADTPVGSVTLCTYLLIIGSKVLCYTKICWKENLLFHR